jgi:hypothetical protein
LTFKLSNLRLLKVAGAKVSFAEARASTADDQKIVAEERVSKNFQLVW